MSKKKNILLVDGWRWCSTMIHLSVRHFTCIYKYDCTCKHNPFFRYWVRKVYVVNQIFHWNMSVITKRLLSHPIFTILLNAPTLNLCWTWTQFYFSQDFVYDCLYFIDCLIMCVYFACLFGIWHCVRNMHVLYEFARFELDVCECWHGRLRRGELSDFNWIPKSQYI